MLPPVKWVVRMSNRQGACNPQDGGRPAQCRQTTCPWARTQELPRAEQGIERPGGSNRKRRRCHTTPAHTKNSEIGLASEKVMAVGDEEAQSHNMPSPITRDKP